ncbi:hypothetical protein [Acidiphilium sp.]|uniref:hypothetical protein n=1 Tax=Acidiphilium sp. TaxID=527 RepID=UPI003D038975
MSTLFEPKRLSELTSAFSGASLSPVLFEQFTSGMMRIAEAEFALLQAVTQAQFGMLEAMMRAGSAATHRPPARPAERSAHEVKRSEHVVA